MPAVNDHQPTNRSNQIAPLLELDLQNRRRAAVAEHARLTAQGADPGLIAEQAAAIANVNDRLMGKRPRGQRGSTVVA